MSAPVKLYRYDLPNEPKVWEGWGVIVIGSDGFFAVDSDFGSYCFSWRHPGTEMRAFILRAEAHQVCMKIGHEADRHVFNASKTRKAVEERIARRRAEGQITDDEARELVDGCSEISDCRSMDAFGAYCARAGGDDCHALYDLAVTDEFSGMLRAFGDRLLQRLKDAIRAELEAERAAAEASAA